MRFIKQRIQQKLTNLLWNFRKVTLVKKDKFIGKN